MKLTTKVAILVSFAASIAGATPSLLLSFDGKGTAMAWDAGVVRALFEKLPVDPSREVFFVGSSSGSIAASYFACRGFTADAIARIHGFAQGFPKEVVEEEVSAKSVQLMLGIPPETTLDAVRPILNLVTDNGSCVPKFPLAIAAANLDVVDGRTSKPFGGKKGRVFDSGRYELSENGRVRGKVCTYFVNPPMAAVLETVPEKERLCDLRLIRTSSDLMLAILASISEPTYYVPVPETDLTTVKSVYQVPSSRLYGGGFVMNSPVQDVKRARPDAWVFGTGRVGYQRSQDRIIKNWFTFPMNETLLHQRWWFDAQVTIDRKQWDALYEKKITPAQQIELGYAHTKKCLAAPTCLPKLRVKPLFSTDVKGRAMDELRGRGVKALF